jgi:hypothetical protein
LATNPGFVNRERLTFMNLQGSRLDLALRNFSGTDAVATTLNPGIYGAMVLPSTAPFVRRVESIRQFTGAVRAVGPSNTGYDSPAPYSFNNAGFGVDAPVTTRNAYRRLDQRLRERFHDVAPATFSVLANSEAGGLRTDFDAYTAATLPANLVEVGRFKAARVSAAGASSTDLLRSEITLDQLLPPPSTLLQTAPTGPWNELVAGIGPIMTEAELSFAFQQTATGGVEAIVTGKVEIWNPYAATMRIPNSATDKLQLRVLVVDANNNEQFSDIQLSDGTGNATMSMAKTLGQIDFPFALTAPGAADLGPGQAKVWTISQTLTVKDAGGNDLAGFNSAGTAVFTTTLGGDSYLTAVLERINSGVVPTKVEKFHTVASVAYPSGTASNDGVRYYFRLKDHSDFTASSSWLDDYDPRGRVVETATSVDNGGSDPGASFGGAFDAGGERIKDAATNPNARTILFDLPRQQFTSIGQLQHMMHTSTGADNNDRAYRLGRGGASAPAINSLFDSHFFSTVPRGVAWNFQTKNALANTSLVIADVPGVSLANLQAAANNDGAARYLLVRDSLNVNSTSVTAWRSLLGGSLVGVDDLDPLPSPADELTYVWDNASNSLTGAWRHIDQTGALRTARLTNAFFRLPQTGANLNGNYVSLKADLSSASAATREEAAYTLGVRALTNAQVDALANQLVTRIRTRFTGTGANSGPFRSIRQFVDSNILQDAIDATNINRPGSTLLPRSALAFLTQQDILQMISHRLFARSDTFTIRAYGEAGSPALDPNDPNFTKGRAWVEATVQRFPTKRTDTNDPGNDMTSTGNAGGDYGREFRIVSLRWLSTNDL